MSRKRTPRRRKATRAGLLRGRARKLMYARDTDLQFYFS